MRDRSPTEVDLTPLDAVLARHADDPGRSSRCCRRPRQPYGYLPADGAAPRSPGAARRRSPRSTASRRSTRSSTSRRAARRSCKICHGTACHVAGAPEVIRAITDELNVEVGATSDDLRFTVEAVACVGCCGLAPVVVVGDQPHGQLDAGERAQAREAAPAGGGRSDAAPSHRRRPSHEVRVCAGSGCVANGSLEIAERFEAAHRRSAALADRVRVVRTGCHGLCAQGPVVVVVARRRLLPERRRRRRRRGSSQRSSPARGPSRRLLYRETADAEPIARYADVPVQRAPAPHRAAQLRRDRSRGPRRARWPPAPTRRCATALDDDDARGGHRDGAAPRACAAAAARASRPA